MSEVLLTLLLAFLTIGMLIPLIPVTGRGRSGRGAKRRTVVWGIGLGLTAALGLTVYSVLFPKDIDRQVIALYTLPVTILVAIAVIVMLVLRRRTGGEASVGFDRALRLLIGLYVIAVLFRDVPTVMTQLVVMFPQNVDIYTTSMTLALLGYALGWVIAVFLGWVAFRVVSSGERIWPQVVAVLVLTLTHALLLVRVARAMKIIELPRPVFKAISWTTNHSALFPILVMAVVLAVALLAVRATRLGSSTEAANPAEGRLARAGARARKVLAGTAAAGYLCGALLVTLGVAAGSQEVELSTPESYAIVDDAASISLDDISDGHLHRYTYTTSSGVEVRFIVIQKAGSSFGVGLDACDICGPSGYYEKDGKVICKLCEVAMNIATIGFKGGCNPIPIEYEVSNGTLTVPLSVLEASADVFA